MLALRRRSRLPRIEAEAAGGGATAEVTKTAADAAADGEPPAARAGGDCERRGASSWKRALRRCGPRLGVLCESMLESANRPGCVLACSCAIADILVTKALALRRNGRGKGRGGDG